MGISIMRYPNDGHRSPASDAAICSNQRAHPRTKNESIIPIKQEVRDGIRRKQPKTFRHTARFSQNFERRGRSSRPRAFILRAVRVNRLGPNQDVEGAAVESFRAAVRYLVRWLREGLGKEERHHGHHRSYSAPRNPGTRRGGGW